MGSHAAAAEAAFRARLAELGAELLEPRWLGSGIPHRARCAAGHECTPRPSNVQKRQGICRTCAGRDPADAEAAFRARLAELGAELLEPRWLGTGVPHRARCAAGHECTPRPNKVRQGGGICRTCSGRDPAAAEAKFRARLAELGAELLERRWLGTKTPHRVRCAGGHECTPRPGRVIEGAGICRKCAGLDPADAEAKFRARLTELGAELLEPAWLGAATPHLVRCAQGHECFPRPHHPDRGQGICRICARRDPATAEAAFRARLAELGAELLEPAWLGIGRAHRVRCAAGHECNPRPGNVRTGQGICITCAGRDPAGAEARFRARVAELGGAVLEPMWLGARIRHRVRCAAGHDCLTLPDSVQAGDGICRYCAGKTWDVFYVVADAERHRIKFGITSGNPRPRLRTHRAAGYREVVSLLTGLPGTVAPEMEAATLSALNLARIVPVHGREYYDISALPVVLDVTLSRAPTAGVCTPPAP